MTFGLSARTGFAADPPEVPEAAQIATENERVVELNEQGSALYTAGDYRRAAERFLQAYAVDEDPNLLFNIGSCYEALGDLDAALEKYRAFLAAPDADPGGRPRAEQAIARLTATDSSSAPEPSQPTVVPAVSEAAVPSADLATADAGAPDTRWGHWVGLVGGTALSAVGATFYLLGSADHAEVTDTPGFGDSQAVAGITRDRADDLVRAGNTKKAIGIASASVGVAAIAGSIVWWLIDPVEPASSDEVVFSKAAPMAISVAPNEAGVQFQGTF